MDFNFMNSVYERLNSISYTNISDSDKTAISFITSKVESTILLKCNIIEVPVSLYPIMIDRICGEFLWSLKELGKLEGFNLESAIKEVKIGDSSVSYAVGSGDKTPEQRLDEFLTYLINEGEKEILCLRRLRW